MDAENARLAVEAFVDSGADRPTLGLVYGRRRIGKSTLLEQVTAERDGFYWEATRGESAIHLTRLSEAIGEHLRVGRLSLETWEEAFSQVLRLGADGAVPVVLDEFGYILEADPSIASIVASALGPGGRRRNVGQARLILCGSAMALMSSLTVGEAALRGRAGMELVMQPWSFRASRRPLGKDASLELALRVFSVIGGVIGYYTDMVDFDLPANVHDFDRWVAERVLSPAATLHYEATTLLAEDPTLSAASPTLHHSILSAIANGSVTAGKIANRLRRSVPHFDPALKRLIEAGFVIRHEDPIRARRPTYALADPFLLFHYAILEPHGRHLRDRGPRTVWKDHLSTIFDIRVRGPVFEELARTWVRRYAGPTTIAGSGEYVGPSTVVLEGKDRELDIIVAKAADPAAPPLERSVVAIGEAKSGATVDAVHLRTLEKARAALGPKAAHAVLLLFAPAFADDVQKEADGRADIELIGLDRLYLGE